MDCLLTILREELVQHLQAVLRGVSPQDGAERWTASGRLR